MRKDLDNIQRCPWCWDFMIMAIIRKIIKQSKYGKHNFVAISWIWCSGKMSQYIDCFGIETLHGRALPFAVGVKLSNPKLKIICIGWDWDWYGIWLWHFLHTCRRDVDLTYIVCDNQNYALTTGQTSPTTCVNQITKNDPHWNTKNPIDPVSLAKSIWCRFSYNTVSNNIKEMEELIIKWIDFDWFAHINIKQYCILNKS